MNSIHIKGNAGFPGACLCGRLLDKPHEVNCVDNSFIDNRRQPDISLSKVRFDWIFKVTREGDLEKTIVIFWKVLNV
ncbi:MAG: hypothetical protein ACYC9L_11015 [Sulfuricaulis sp.]